MLELSNVDYIFQAFSTLIALLLVSYTPSFILGAREAIYADTYMHGLENNCSAIPLWVQQLETISQLFKTVFSSLGGIIYCISCVRFRKKIKLLMGQTPPPPNNSFADIAPVELISQTNEAIPLEILSNAELIKRAETMALNESEITPV